MYKITTLMAKADSLESLKRLLIHYFESEAIPSLAFTFYKHHTKTGSQLIYDWVSPPLRRWHEHYLEQQYADIDRTLESTEQSLIPIYWDVKAQLAQAKNSRERRIRQESIDFSIDKGLCLSMHGPQGDFAVLVLHQFIGQRGLESWQEKQYSWLAITHYYFHYLRK